MNEKSTARGTTAAPIRTLELRRLQRRSNAVGVSRLAAHLAVIISLGTLYAFALERGAPWPLCALALVAFGFSLVTMFAAMHEAVHRTAFASSRLNDGVAWLAGLLSFYNSTFYRQYHGWHHRSAQIPGEDPELEDGKPTSLGTYALEMSGVTWWLGKLRTHFTLALGRTGEYEFLNESTGPEAVRSVRLQLLTYGLAIAASVALGYPYFAVYWLVPVVAGQPLLRMILLAEHTGCGEGGDALGNTRTTYTAWPVRFLMWEMPYHAEHHRYPSLPFFALAEAHQQLEPHLQHVARSGYSGLHFELLRELLAKRRTAS